MDWRDEARCLDIDYEGVDASFIFFGDADIEISPILQLRAAQSLCRSCDVQVSCLRYACEIRAEFGVWGGLTESQRKRYLYPAIRQHGLSDETLMLVIERVRRGQTGRRSRSSGQAYDASGSEHHPMTRPA